MSKREDRKKKKIKEQRKNKNNNKKSNNNYHGYYEGLEYCSNLDDDEYACLWEAYPF